MTQKTRRNIQETGSPGYLRDALRAWELTAQLNASSDMMPEIQVIAEKRRLFAEKQLAQAKVTMQSLTALQDKVTSLGPQFTAEEKTAIERLTSFDALMELQEIHYTTMTEVIGLLRKEGASDKGMMSNNINPKYLQGMY